jgi:hypothetical protein
MDYRALRWLAAWGAVELQMLSMGVDNSMIFDLGPTFMFQDLDQLRRKLLPILQHLERLPPAELGRGRDLSSLQLLIRESKRCLGASGAAMES